MYTKHFHDIDLFHPIKYVEKNAYSSVIIIKKNFYVKYICGKIKQN